MKQANRILYRITFLTIFVLIILAINAVSTYCYWASDNPRPTGWTDDCFCSESGQKRGYYGLYYKEKTITYTSEDGEAWHILRIYC